ncbi:MAG: hypothetical protein NTX64_00250 [Elusimicrobia bacterium]|nr:hypothetical protein [Elusimicrobiota bacterium]
MFLSAVLAFALYPWAQARADITDSGNLQAGNQAIISGTMTVQGDAFSVGGASLSVTSGMTGVGTAAPAATLDVNGNAQFGSTSKSTFTSDGNLLVPGSVTGSAFFGDGSHLTGIVTGGEANTFTSSKTFTSDVLARSSVTASAFFGDGSHLTGIVTSGETNTFTSSKTFTSSVLAGGSVTASAFFGDGAHLTGIVTSGETNTFTSSKTFTSNVLARSSVTASAFFGDGSHLTGVSAGENNTYGSSKTFTNNVLAKASVTASGFFGTSLDISGDVYFEDFVDNYGAYEQLDEVLLDGRNNNLVLGLDAGQYRSASAQYNTYLGQSAGSSLGAGSGNTLTGTSSGEGASLYSRASNNSGYGYSSLRFIADGSSNTVLGFSAGSSIVNGNNNIVIGQQQDTVAPPIWSGDPSNTLNLGGLIFGVGLSSVGATGGQVGINTRNPIAGYGLDASTAIHTNSSMTASGLFGDRQAFQRRRNEREAAGGHREPPQDLGQCGVGGKHGERPQPTGVAA